MCFHVRDFLILFVELDELFITTNLKIGSNPQFYTVNLYQKGNNILGRLHRRNLSRKLIRLPSHDLRL